MKTFKILVFGAALVLLGASFAHAAVPKIPSSRVTSPVTGTATNGAVKTQMLGQLDAEIALLKREVEISKLHADLRKARQGGGKPTSGQQSLEPPQIGGTQTGASSIAGLRSLMGGALPTIKQISGVGKHISAVLQYADGSTVQVVPGSQLEPQLLVVAIRVSSVLVRDHGHIVPLRFSGAGPTEGKGSQ